MIQQAVKQEIEEQINKLKEEHAKEIQAARQREDEHAKEIEAAKKRQAEQDERFKELESSHAQALADLQAKLNSDTVQQSVEIEASWMYNIYEQIGVYNLNVTGFAQKEPSIGA